MEHAKLNKRSFGCTKTSLFILGQPKKMAVAVVVVVIVVVVLMGG
jgi:hypothetical protein